MTNETAILKWDVYPPRISPKLIPPTSVPIAGGGPATTFSSKGKHADEHYRTNDKDISDTAVTV